MNHLHLQEKWMQTAKQLEENVILPDHVTYVPDTVYARNYRKAFAAKVAVAIFCIILLLTTTGFMLAEGLLFIPGLGAVRAETTQITHSIAGITEVELDDYTHKIISGYIKNKRVYMEIFYYKTDVGLTFDPQYELSVDPETLEWSYGQPVDYEVYCNGEKGVNYQKSYGSSISISYELPVVHDGEVTTVSLYSGDIFISDLVFYPAAHFSEIEKPIPYAENNDVILTADIDKKDGYVDIYIGALLPEDAFREENMLPVGSVNGQELGYSESEVFLRDGDGLQYFHKFHDVEDSLDPARWDSIGNEEAAFLLRWHCYRFVIPKDLDEFTVVIPEITYFCGNANEVDFKTVTGPWEIPVNLNQSS